MNFIYFLIWDTVSIVTEFWFFLFLNDNDVQFIVLIYFLKRQRVFSL